MRALIAALVIVTATLGHTKPAAADPITYSFDDGFLRYYAVGRGNGTTRNLDPAVNTFGGKFTIDPATNMVTDFDMFMVFGFRYFSSANTRYDFEKDQGHVATASDSSITFRWNTATTQYRLRADLDDNSSWGDRNVIIDFVMGDIDTPTLGAFRGASPDNNDTGASPVAIKAVANVPLPASALLLVGGLAGLGMMRRHRQAQTA